MNYLRDRVSGFAAREDFPEQLFELFEEYTVRIITNLKAHPDGFSEDGLPAIAFSCKRKARRFYSTVIEQKDCKGDLEDELEDQLEYAVYALLYYRMLKKQEVENAQHKQDVRDT